MSLITITFILFLIMDPFGNVSSFHRAMLQPTYLRQCCFVLREMLIALIAMLVFCALSNWIFWLLDLSEVTVRIASGIILFLTAVKILFPTPNSPRARAEHFTEEPFVIPLAIPLTAGPSLLATIILFTHQVGSCPAMFAAIMIAWLVSTAILLLAHPLQRLLGYHGLEAIEKLMGMILVLLAIQRFVDGGLFMIKELAA